MSERKTMNLFKKNQMTLKEIERFMDAKRKREAKREAKRKAATEMFWFKQKRDQQQDWG